MSSNFAKAQAEKYLAQVRERICSRCKMSLVCLMGRELSDTEVYWCQKCQGWWFPEQDYLLRCTAFIVGVRGTIVIDERTSRTRNVTVRGMRTLIESCPHCDPRGEEPIEVFEGYNETDEA